MTRPKRGHGEGTISKTENGRFRARLRLPDGSRISKTFVTRREAREWIARASVSIQNGLRPIDASRTTVSQYLDHWLSKIVIHRIRPRTLESYAGAIENHIKPSLGHLTLSKLQVDDVDNMIAAICDTGHKRTASLARTVLRAALNDALRRGEIVRNVAALAQAPKTPKREMHTLTPDQVRQFIAGTVEDKMHALYVLAVLTGMRQGELLGLHWAAVHLDEGTLQVTQALQLIRGKGLVFSEPKTHGARRLIHLPAPAVRALREHRRRQLQERLSAGPRWIDHDLVFPTGRGTPYNPRNLLRAYKDALERIFGRPVAKMIRFHDLRHTCATNMLASGVHPKIVQELLGHASITLTLDTYSHTTPAMHREAMDTMTRILEA